MILKTTFTILACCGLLLAAGGDDLTGIKCLVNGDKNANKSASAKHLDGEVYFCCQGCVKKFEKDPASYEIKANHQLVVTGQYVQKGCPFSGNAVNEKAVVDVGGAEVAFCCEHCQGKVAKAGDVAAKANMVFTKAAFEKAFAKKESEISLKDVKCPLMPKRGVTEEHAVDYKDGKIFFCCKGCPKKFASDKAKFATVANQQLVATGQYVQTGCPFSGSPVDDAQSTKFGNTEVKYCCEHCKDKVVSAADDKAKADLVFSDKAFEKAFSKKK